MLAQRSGQSYLASISLGGSKAGIQDIFAGAGLDYLGCYRERTAGWAGGTMDCNSFSRLVRISRAFGSSIRFFNS